MKAVIYTHYGRPDVLQLKEIDKPQPEDNEVLIRVHATTVNRTDNATTKAIPFFARPITGWFKPKKQTPGTEFSGEVEAIGKDVSSLKVGDRVFGFNDLGSRAQAEYLTISAEYATTIPEGISYKQAAASSEGAHYAHTFLKKVDIQPGQDILVYGASGGIGSAAVQLLKTRDVNVTAVCGTRNVELMKSIGADHVIDYTRQDFTKGEKKYHHIFDAVGKVSFFKCWRVLLPGGVYISSDLGFMGQNLFLPLITPLIKPLIGNKKAVFPLPTDIPGSLALIKRLMAEGRFTPIIDREFPLENIVEAYRYVEKEHKTGNVVVNILP